MANEMCYDLIKEKAKYLKESEEGVAHMCKIMEEALEQEARETTIEHIKKLMRNLKWTAEQAMDALDIPKAEQTAYLKMI